MQLIDRIEAAEKGSRELDLDLWWQCKANRGSANEPMPEDYRQSNLRMDDAPRYTTSLDAAMTLVVEGAGICLDRYWIAEVDDPVWLASIQTGGIPGNPRQVFEVRDRPTPALAICAAALKARQ